MTIKIAHEAPNEIFQMVQQLTDYDYCLVHLMDESEEYRDNFLRAKKQGREIILDNSIFELGTAFNGIEYHKWITELKPTYFIIPDVLESMEGTIKNFRDWQNVRTPGSKRIAVLQGKSYQELCECYRVFLEGQVDKIGVSFDYSFYENSIPYARNVRSPQHLWMLGRIQLIESLMQEPFFDPNMPLHLLGISLPQEYLAYQNYNFIDSMDSSGPVIHGLKGILYNPLTGLQHKESVKLFTLIDSDVNFKQIEHIMQNIETFKNFCS